MNILTGRSQEDEEAEAAAKAKAAAESSSSGGRAADGAEPDAAPAPAKLVQLRYGSYQGLQLSAAEVRRIKAEECRALLAKKKLSLVLDLDHTLLNSAMYAELNQEQGDKLEAWLTAQGKREGETEAGEKEAGEKKAEAGATGVDGGAEECAAAAGGSAAGEVESNGEPVADSSGGGGDGGGGDGGGGGGSSETRALTNGSKKDEEDAMAWLGLTGSPADANGSGHGTAAGASDSSRSGGGGERDELLYHMRHMRMWTKLRPYVREFLASASEHFELYVYTMGARGYAKEMVGLLDPTGELGLRASDRVIGKEDSTAEHTKDLDVILGSERTTIIVDDSPAVWPQFAAQLLVPRRYHYFPSSAARDASLPPAFQPHLSLGKDELAENGQLHALLTALKGIHAHYFDVALPESADGPNIPPHVSASVRAVRRRVLGNHTLVFSHIIPLEQQRTPEAHSAWRLASELGAKIQSSVGKGVTHVVAGSDHTDKVRWARSKGVPAVSIDWLATCGYLWRAADEEGMDVSTIGVAKGGQPAKSLKLAEDGGTLPPPKLES